MNEKKYTFPTIGNCQKGDEYLVVESIYCNKFDSEPIQINDMKWKVVDGIVPITRYAVVRRPVPIKGPKLKKVKLNKSGAQKIINDFVRSQYDLHGGLNGGLIPAVKALRQRINDNPKLAKLAGYQDSYELVKSAPLVKKILGINNKQPLGLHK